MPEVPTGERKIEHVRLCLNEEVGSVGVTTGFERYRFRHSALPEIDFEDIKLDTAFLGFSVRTPFLISSMTGEARPPERLIDVWLKRGTARLGTWSRLRAGAVEKEELAPVPCPGECAERSGYRQPWSGA